MAAARRREFCTITVTDGSALGHEGMRSTLVSREGIADSVELTMRGHCYDALVGLAGCDKFAAGHDDGDAAAQCAVSFSLWRFDHAGPLPPERRDVTVVDVFEGVGQHSAGKMPESELCLLEKVACPGAGACGGQFTANTMACVAEAIGLALPYSSGPPAVILERDDFALKAGQTVMKLLEKNLRPRDIVTRKALENAAMVVASTGGSTNAALHLPAMANEAGIKFDLFDVAEIFKKTPYIASMKPGGKYVANRICGKPAACPMLMRSLLDAGFLPCRLHHRHRQDCGGKSQGPDIQSRPEGHCLGGQGVGADRRRGRPQRQSRARRAPS